MTVHETARRPAVPDFLAGMRAVAPVLLGVVPFATVAGIAAVEVGLSPWEALGMSVVVYAGAAQLAGLQLIGVGAVPVVVVLTAAIINLRMVMYSASIAPHFAHLAGLRRGFLAYFLTDHAFAIVVTRFARQGVADLGRAPFYLGVAASIWVVWQLGTLSGALLGTGVPEEWSLDFAVPLTFIALLVPNTRDRAGGVAAVTGGVAAVLLSGLPYNLGLVCAALLGVAGGVAASRWGTS